MEKKPLVFCVGNNATEDRKKREWSWGSSSWRTNWLWLKAPEFTHSHCRSLESEHSFLLGCFYFTGVVFSSSFISHKWIGHHSLSTVCGEYRGLELTGLQITLPSTTKCCCTKASVQFLTMARITWGYWGRTQSEMHQHCGTMRYNDSVGSIYTINCTIMLYLNINLMCLGHVQHKMLFLAPAYIH